MFYPDIKFSQIFMGSISHLLAPLKGRLTHKSLSVETTSRGHLILFFLIGRIYRSYQGDSSCGIAFNC